MAIVPDGGDTTVYTEVMWNNQIGSIRGFAADGPNDCKVSTTTGQGMVTSVAAGIIYAHGSRAVSDSAVNVTHAAAPASGIRYDLVVARWDYSPVGSGGNAGLTVTFVAISGGPTRAMPTKNRTKGVLVDQPLALVPISSGSASPGAPIDLRTWGVGPVHIGDTVGIDPLDWPMGTEFRVGWGSGAARYEITPNGTSRQLSNIGRVPVTCGAPISVTTNSSGAATIVHNLGWVPGNMVFTIGVGGNYASNIAVYLSADLTQMTATTATIVVVTTNSSGTKPYQGPISQLYWTAFEGKKI